MIFTVDNNLCHPRLIDKGAYGAQSKKLIHQPLCISRGAFALHHVFDLLQMGGGVGQRV